MKRQPALYDTQAVSACVCANNIERNNGVYFKFSRPKGGR
jgi:hypothetical protein